MRVRELKYSLAVKTCDSLIGGLEGSYLSPKFWDYHVDIGYLEGNFDDAQIFDSHGRVFSVEKILLSKPKFKNRVLNRLGHFLILPDKFASRCVYVDLELSEESILTPHEMWEIFDKFIDENPSWLGNYERRNALSEFDDTMDHGKIINSLGYLESPRAIIRTSRSNKVVDLRS